MAEEQINKINMVMNGLVNAEVQEVLSGFETIEINNIGNTFTLRAVK